MSFDPEAAVRSTELLNRLYKHKEVIEASFVQLQQTPAGAPLQDATFRLATAHSELRGLGFFTTVDEEDRKNLLATFFQERELRDFVDKLSSQIRTSPPLFRAFSHVLPSSFPAPALDEWKRYREKLSLALDEPIWGGDVGIRNLFVPPRYTYQIRNNDKEERKDKELPIETDPTDLIIKLLTSPQPNPDLVFVLGGPGLGKSSFAGMLAAKLAKDESVQPVLIRLRGIDPTKPLLSEIKRLLQQDNFPKIAQELTWSSRLVLILDGFDELAHATHSLLGTFFFQAKDLLREYQKLGLRLLLTGRDTIFSPNDTALPAGSHIIRLQPFSPEQIKKWCINWQLISGRSFNVVRFLPTHKTDIPSNEPLQEIISQPVMLYMLAKMESEGITLPEKLEEAHKAKIYLSIIDWCCKRHQDLRPTDEWRAPQMRRFLRLAGYAAMVRGKQVIHLHDLEVAIHAAGLPMKVQPEENRFEAEKIILSFAFQTNNNSHQSWEFTHKSFGEYLAAEHLASACHRITEQAQDEFGEPQFRLNDSQATQEWINTFGTTFVSPEIETILLSMLDNWIGFLSHSTTREKVKVDPLHLRARFGAIYRLLMEETEIEETIRVAKTWSGRPSHIRGYAIANLFALAGIVSHSDENLFEPEKLVPGKFFDAYQAAHLVLSKGRVPMERTFGRLSLAGAKREFFDSHWSGVFLPFIKIRNCNFATAQLRQAFFWSADLSNSDLRGAVLNGADFTHANLSKINFTGANLSGADFEHANLEGANLLGAKFTRVNLEGANLKGTILSNTMIDPGDREYLLNLGAIFGDEEPAKKEQPKTLPPKNPRAVGKK